MGMRPARFCGKCMATAAPRSNLCARHQVAIPDARHGSRNPLYNRAVWRIHTRRAVLARDGQCSFIANGTRCQRLANQIHHIIPWEEWTAAGNDFCDIENLCGLCKEHHDAIRHMPFALDVLALPWREVREG